MEEMIEMNNNCEIEPLNAQNGIIALSDDLLADARLSISNGSAISIPIAELSTLGAGVSSLIPAFNSVTQTTSIAADGLYRIANAAAGDTLKIAKNGNAWGAMKTAAGGSKMAQLAEAGPLSATTKAVSAFNPATMLMAATLYSVEKQMSEITETQKQILSFLEIEKESEIEGNVETLTELVKNFKHNWNNLTYVTNSHKTAMDIKRKARSDMISYQKKVAEIISSKKLLVSQNQVDACLNDLVKKFKYYRLSLYSFSLASMMEIMLGGNFAEEYISGMKEEISTMDSKYRNTFEQGSLYLETLGRSAVESNVLKGLGKAENATGKFIEKIPFVNKGSVDEFLQEKGSYLARNANRIEKKAVRQFASLANPGTGVFAEKMGDMIQIYNHTEQICFDDKNIYLVAD